MLEELTVYRQSWRRAWENFAGRWGQEGLRDQFGQGDADSKPLAFHGSKYPHAVHELNKAIDRAEAFAGDRDSRRTKRFGSRKSDEVRKEYRVLSGKKRSTYRYIPSERRGLGQGARLWVICYATIQELNKRSTGPKGKVEAPVWRLALRPSAGNGSNKIDLPKPRIGSKPDFSGL
jgi:hypothetical protein